MYLIQTKIQFMNRDENTRFTFSDSNRDNSTFESFPDVTPRREGGDDALAESSPTDSRLDEKVIVNQQRGDKTVKGQPQTAANTSDATGSDDEIQDDQD